jgi:hypothetical protein
VESVDLSQRPFLVRSTETEVRRRARALAGARRRLPGRVRRAGMRLCSGPSHSRLVSGIRFHLHVRVGRVCVLPIAVLRWAGLQVRTNSVIVATGALAKRLGIPNEEVFWSSGISACAICDGASHIFRNKVRRRCRDWAARAHPNMLWASECRCMSGMAPVGKQQGSSSPGSRD